MKDEPDLDTLAVFADGGARYINHSGRMTFLVSDGLSFGEGPMDAIQQDPMAAPLLGAATSLLLKLVDKTSDVDQDPAAG